MQIIRCLICNKVLGEVEGKAKIKCKRAGCHCTNVIDTEASTQFEEARLVPSEESWVVASNTETTQFSREPIEAALEHAKAITRGEFPDELRTKMARLQFKDTYEFKPNN